MSAARIRGAIVLVTASLLFALAAPSVASAHARYKSSTPGTGEVLSTSPARLTIMFTQNVQKVTGTYGIDVQRDGGGTATAGPAVLDDTDRSQLRVPLLPALAAGRYVVRWTNVSDDDGDPAEGAFSFYVNTQPTPADLQADEQLQTIGAEETPAATTTERAASPAAAAATAVATAARTSGGGGGNTALYVVIGVVGALALAAGAGGWWYLRRRS